jgi:adrenodoxin-NADP+ reductase
MGRISYHLQFNIVICFLLMIFSSKIGLTTRLLCRIPGRRCKHYVAIVGSGPSGFYSAKYLFEKHPCIHVDVYEKLPTPYGLVRYGVAPDHQETKNVMNTFAEVAKNERFRYFGNVEVGPIQEPKSSSSAQPSHHNRIAIKRLIDAYSAVILAYGASSDNSLNLPGEELDGIFSAREFVNWYNGHPEYAHLGRKLNLENVRNVVIIGHGNVAIDCARVLAKDPMTELSGSDITSYALEALKRSPIQNIRIVGRRGHVQSSFTIKELRELTKLSTINLKIDKVELEQGMTDASKQELQLNRPKQRISDLITTISSASETSPLKPKSLEMRFLTNPLQFEADEKGRVKSMLVERCRLEGSAGNQKAVSNPDIPPYSIPCDLVLKSVGFRCLSMMSIPFNAKTATIPHLNGRVIVESSSSADLESIYPKLYVTGWLKRGATGIIGTNIPDAKETVASVLEDLSKQDESLSIDRVDPVSLLPTLQSSTVVSWQGYLALDDYEIVAGKNAQPAKIRMKVTDIDEMLKHTSIAN